MRTASTTASPEGQVSPPHSQGPVPTAPVRTSVEKQEVSPLERVMSQVRQPRSSRVDGLSPETTSGLALHGQVQLQPVKKLREWKSQRGSWMRGPEGASQESSQMTWGGKGTHTSPTPMLSPLVLANSVLYDVPLWICTLDFLGQPRNTAHWCQKIAIQEETDWV